MFLAYLISRIFDPGIIFAFLMFLTIWLSKLNFSSKINWTIILEFLIIVIPCVYLFWLVKTKKVSDIDITDHKQRWKLFLPTTIVWAISFILVTSYNLPIEVIALVAFGLSTILVWTLITPFYKISAHIAGMVNLTIFLWFILGMNLALVIGPILLIVVAWSRFVQNKHTIWQMVWGLLLSVILDMSVIRYLIN